MSEHSPTPWIIERSHVTGDINLVMDSEGRNVRLYGFGLTDTPKAYATTEFIVRAVNAHAEMLAALKIVRHRLNRNGDIRQHQPQIEAAIALAEAGTGTGERDEP